MGKIIDALRANNTILIQHASNEADDETVWKGRKALYGTAYQVMPHVIVEDVTVQISKIPDLVKGIEQIGRKHNVNIINFGHTGNGNLHPNIIFKGDSKGEIRGVEKASADIFKLAIVLGGTLTSEHGIGLAKASFIVQLRVL